MARVGFVPCEYDKEWVKGVEGVSKEVITGMDHEV